MQFSNWLQITLGEKGTGSMLLKSLRIVRFGGKQQAESGLFWEIFKKFKFKTSSNLKQRFLSFFPSRIGVSLFTSCRQMVVFMYLEE